jgi:hypothetical protein
MKSEVYSWRVSPELKAKLEEAARDEHTSLARLLEKIVREWLGRARPEGDDGEEQRRLHEEAAPFIGKIRGQDPRRAREASQRVREKLKKGHGS